MTLTVSARLAGALLLLARPVLAQEDAPPAPKRADIALGLSLAGTAAGAVALFAASTDGAADTAPIAVTGIGLLVLGPSLGHLYAGETGRALRHAAVRAGAVAVMGAGLLVAWSSPCAFGPENDDHCPNARDRIGVGIIAAGAALGVGSIVYSIIDAPRAADRSNRAQPALAITPVPVISPNRSTGPGLSVAGRF
jgi:hypothetical protein